MRKLFLISFYIWVLAGYAGMPLRAEDDIETRTTNRTSDPYLKLQILDAQNKEVLPYATVRIQNGSGQIAGSTSDEEGIVLFHKLKEGTYELTVSFVGYHSYRQSISLSKDVFLQVKLEPTVSSLQEVIITASESTEGSTTSKINRDAMKHLQPSSFADLLELIPGGSSKDPVLNTPNLVKLREAGSATEKYGISSMGTAFLVDGVPLSGDANLQYVAGGSSSSSSGTRDFTSRGVDMRSIPTDNIESIEVIRGIPSAEYGNLTSGIIKIERKEGVTDLNGRFKADLYGKLFSIGKGLRLNETSTLNIHADYLDSKADPRNNLENYKRITASIRFTDRQEKEGCRQTFRTSFDYSGSIDNEKIDPDITFDREEKYRSTYNRFAWNGSMKWDHFTNPFLQLLEANAAVSYQHDKIEETKYVSLNRLTAVPVANEEGEWDANFLPYQYMADYLVDGKPLSLFLKTKGFFRWSLWNTGHLFKTGVEWTYDRNLGNGQVYDPLLPAYPTNRRRPRSYKELPAAQVASFFMEDEIKMPMGRQSLQMNVGVRGLMMLGLGKEYAINNRLYLDPRINVQWNLPKTEVGGQIFSASLGAGWGIHHKTPTIAQLSPEPYYEDITQLNYYHNNPDLRRMNMRTYVIDRTNYDLRAATNQKFEIRADIAYGGNRFSVTAFRENMNDGFRQVNMFRSMSYKNYDATSIDASGLTAPPSLNDISWTPDTLLKTYSYTDNHTQILKKGVEFQFMSARIKPICTRFTVNGAWFKTIYNSSQPFYRASSEVIDGRLLRYIGIYETEDGSEKEQFNTNFIADTYLPKLKFNLSMAFECMWFTSSRTLPRSGVPVAYVDAAGIEHPYTAESAKDKYLQWLILPYSENTFLKSTVPFCMNVNLKATKEFGKFMRLALFVNKMLDYNPSYQVNGKVVRRSVSPYFGMELNLSI